MSRPLNISQDEIATKYVGVSVPIPLYKILRQEAAKDDMSLSGLLRTALIKHLERDRRKKPTSD